MTMTFVRFLSQLLPNTSSHRRHHGTKGTDGEGLLQNYHQHGLTLPAEVIAERKLGSPVHGHTSDLTAPTLQFPTCNKSMARAHRSASSLDSLSSTPLSFNSASSVMGSDSRTVVHVCNAMTDSNPSRRRSLALSRGGEDYYYHSERADDNHKVYPRRLNPSRHLRGHHHERQERCDRRTCHKYDDDTRRKQHLRRTPGRSRESTGSLTPEDSQSLSHYDKKAKVRSSSYRPDSVVTARSRSRPEVVRPEPISLLWPHALLESTLTPISRSHKSLVVHT